MTPSKILFYLCVSFVFGIALSSFIKIPEIFASGFLLVAVGLIAVSFFACLRRQAKKETAIIGFCILLLVLGIMRFQIAQFAINSNTLIALNDQPEKVTLSGIIADEPDMRSSSQKLNVKVGDGMVLVTVGPNTSYHYLDAVKITGLLKTPAVFEDFNYKNYLLKDGVYSVMDYPKVEIIPDHHQYSPWTFFYQHILWLKQGLLQSLNMAFVPPQSYIMQGIVFGDNSHMSKELKDQFNATGLSHITAVSGTNIVILISILVGFLLALGFWRSQALYGALALVWFYIILIGFPISGVRAVIMGSSALVAQIFGRQNTSSRVIVATAALLLLQNPLLLFYDISFQLSFLASLAIIHVKPILDMTSQYLAKYWQKTKKDEDMLKSTGRFFWDIISTTIAVQLLALPVMIYNFGAISWISLLTNLLVLPIISLLTVMGFLVSVVGVFSGLLGWILALPSVFLLWYLVKVLDIFSQPWALVVLQNVSWLWLAGYYIVLGGILWHINKKSQPAFLDY